MKRTIASSGLLFALTLFAACGGTAPHPNPNPNPDPGTPDGGPGAPTELAALSGALSAKQGAGPQSPVRLALAWYPGLLDDDGQFSGPRSIHTEDVAYSGSLPQDYRFKITQEPPEAARVAVEGIEGKAALGILLAYRDGNANGVLDTIPENGVPVDHVLGSSFRWDAAPAYAVIFLEQAQSGGQGLKKGFNLLELDGAESSELVPMSTTVPVELTEGGAALDVFVCEAAWVSQGTCGLDFGSGEEEEPAKTIEVTGQVGVFEDVLKVNVDVGVDGVYAKDAQVQLDGVDVPFAGACNGYCLEVSRAEFPVGASLSLVVTHGATVQERTLIVPGAFETSAPDEATLGGEFTVSWTKSYGAGGYRAFLEPKDGMVRGGAVGAEARSFTFNVLETPGPADVTVMAITQNLNGTERQRIDVLRVHHRGILLVDPEAPSLQVTGSLLLERYGSSLVLQVLVDGQPSTDAQVWLNGVVIPASTDTQLYEYDEYSGDSIWDDAPNTLIVWIGESVITRTLTAPGTVGIVTPGIGVKPSGSATLDVSWTQSTDADYYRAAVYSTFFDAISAQTEALSAALPAPNATGVGVLSVHAVSIDEENDDLGRIEVMRSVTRTLDFQ